MIRALIAVCLLVWAAGCDAPEAGGSGGSGAVPAQYRQSCAPCHDTGAADAPIPGEPSTWSAREGISVDELLPMVVSGNPAMPARGRCYTCSDDQLRAIIAWMVAQ